MSEQPSQTFHSWAIVEIMGHVKIAGLVSEQPIAGCNMLRIDVPETESQQAFTKYYGGSSIYSITPVDETTARIAAKGHQVAPVNAWNGQSFTDQFLKSKPALEYAEQREDDDWQDDDHD
jgi:hypothetical protein